MDTEPGDRRDRRGESWANQRAGGAVKLERCQNSQASGAWCHPLSHFLESFSNIHIFYALSNQVTLPLAGGEEGSEGEGSSETRSACGTQLCSGDTETPSLLGTQEPSLWQSVLAASVTAPGNLCPSDFCPLISPALQLHTLLQWQSCL